jgi:hypothetical protein
VSRGDAAVWHTHWYQLNCPSTIARLYFLGKFCILILHFLIISPQTVGYPAAHAFLNMSSLTDSGTVLAWTTSGSPIGIAWNAVLFLFATIGFAHCVGLLSAKPAAAPRVSVSDTHTDPEPLSKARTAAAPEPAGLQPSPFVFPAPNSDESWPCPRARTVASLREALALVPASVFDSTVAASAAQAARASPPEWERWATDRGLLLPPTDPGAPLRLALPSFSPVSPCLSGAVPGLGADAGLPVSPVSQAVGRRVPTVHMLCGMICSGKSSIAKVRSHRLTSPCTRFFTSRLTCHCFLPCHPPTRSPVRPSAA